MGNRTVWATELINRSRHSGIRISEPDLSTVCTRFRCSAEGSRPPRRRRGRQHVAELCASERVRMASNALPQIVADSCRTPLAGPRSVANAVPVPAVGACFVGGSRARQPTGAPTPFFHLGVPRRCASLSSWTRTDTGGFARRVGGQVTRQVGPIVPVAPPSNRMWWV